jgi:hypothetical protein
VKTINLGAPNGPDNRTCPCHRRKANSSFKKKPHLGIKKPLASVPIQLEARTPNESDERQTFNANIWTLGISNTRPRWISSNALECSARLHIRDVGADIPLRWNTRNIQPEECAVDTSVRLGDSAVDHYHRSMPYFYAVLTLASQYGLSEANIYQGEQSSLYLLFTYEGSNRAFIVTPIRIPEWYGDREVFYSKVSDWFLFINQGEEHKWTIRVESNPLKAMDGSTRPTETAYKKFRIKFNSWDDVEIL